MSNILDHYLYVNAKIYNLSNSPKTSNATFAYLFATFIRVQFLEA